MKKHLKKIFVVVGIIAVAALAYIYFNQPKSVEDMFVLHTVTVERGDLQDTISASGTVEPEELVNVGAQVTGRIMRFGKDADGGTVDYGSKVKQGMPLAYIDEALYAAALKEAKAQKLQANAAIKSAAADSKQAKAKLALATANWTRAQELYPKHALSKSDYDSAEAEFLTCSANVAVAEAAERKAEAQLAIAEATLDKAERNMSYCEIISPVDGIVIDRRVSIGQTLVSSMSASSVFLIAKDLRKLQVWVSVNEADIGDIKPGMKVIFSVDTFPNLEFSGVVKKVRLNATLSQNIVTYVVEVSTDNKDGKLLPYLTANVQFIRQERKDTLYLPTAALRFVPDAMLVAESDRVLLAQSRRRGGKERVVWVKADKGLLRPVKVKTGINAGTEVEIFSDELTVGSEVVVAAVEQTDSNKAAGGDNSNPFMPKMPSRNRMNLNSHSTPGGKK